MSFMLVDDEGRSPGLSQGGGGHAREGAQHLLAVATRNEENVVGL